MSTLLLAISYFFAPGIAGGCLWYNQSDGYAPVSGFQLTPNDEEYDESNVSVLLAVPGQKTRTMRLLDALIETEFRCTHVRQVPTFDLYMAYEKKAVVTVNGETYLTGPAIVFYCLDDELWNISSGDAGLVRRLFEERTVQLHHGNEMVPAIAL